MKVLFVIPHYYRGVAEQTRYASHSILMKENRRQVLDTLIFKLHLLFGTKHYGALHHLVSMEEMPNPFAFDFDIKVCTTGDDHLVKELNCPHAYFEHVQTNAPPLQLGFHAQRVMKDYAGQYDYYCYMEDDILIHDQFFFKKLVLFNNNGRAEHLLQPQRYESCMFNGDLKNDFLAKIYPDYQRADLPDGVANYSFNFLGIDVVLSRTTLSHAGSFYLTAEQFEHLYRQKEFGSAEGVREADLLDCAATMAISRHFTIFKTHRSCMSFFEVEHGHSNMISQVTLDEKGEIHWSW